MSTAAQTDVLACPVCATASRREASFADVVLHRCPACDHLFTDVASLEFLGEYDEAWEALHQNWFDHPNVELFEFIARTIEGYGAGSSVIDIGAGRGELLEYLHGRLPGAALTGLDVALQPTIAGVEVVLDDIATVDFGARRWHVALSLATIEHLPDVHMFASRLRGLTAPGGLAIVMTNNERSVPYDAARLLRKVGYEVPFRRLYDRHHLNHFNIGSLQALMETHGFELLKLKRHNMPLAAVDMPKDSRFLRLAVGGMFAFGRVTGRTFLQTAVFRSPDRPA